MAKQKAVASSSFWGELFRLGAYKKRQGRTARQVTFATMALIVLVGSYRFNIWLRAIFQESVSPSMRVGVVWAMVAIGLFLSYRLVNYSRFADFLIAVEAEMSKVSWPSRQELIRSSIVVIATMFILAAVLFAYDIVLTWLFQTIGVKL